MQRRSRSLGHRRSSRVEWTEHQPRETYKTALRSTARRWLHLDKEIAELNTHIAGLTAGGRAGSPRAVIWFELWVTDVERAKAFDGELFGWTLRLMAEYHPDYWLVDAGEGRARSERRGSAIIEACGALPPREQSSYGAAD